MPPSRGRVGKRCLLSMQIRQVSENAVNHGIELQPGYTAPSGISKGGKAAFVLHRFCIVTLQIPLSMKRSIVFYIFTVAVSLCCISCSRPGHTHGSTENSDTRTFSAVSRQDGSTPPDCEGTYAGSPPLFSGTMTTVITLGDNRYLLKRIYSIKNEDKGFEMQGDYTRSTDGGRIHLHGDAFPTLYLVGQDVLIPLDDDGRPLASSGQIFCLRKVALR